MPALLCGGAWQMRRHGARACCVGAARSPRDHDLPRRPHTSCARSCLAAVAHTLPARCGHGLKTGGRGAPAPTIHSKGRPMRNMLFAGACALAILPAMAAQAHTDTAAVPRPNAHAPIGVMGDHLHKKGEWMAGYHYRRTSMKGLRDGTESVSDASVLATYGETPLDMVMDMHMFELMYGVTDDLTLMVMPQFMQMSMLHKSHGMHAHMHEHEISGFGDTELTALYSVWRSEGGGASHRFHLNGGVSLPTGSAGETFTNHHAMTYRMPYNMQLGSGTFDPILGATYTGEAGNWSWGAQTLNYLRFGRNGQGYRQGNRYTGSLWGARAVADWLTCGDSRRGSSGLQKADGEVLREIWRLRQPASSHVCTAFNPACAESE
ncbi:MAG: hypothetical protein GC131_08615 [Alphaproteobacteria bacterium]|nr:hypothetical protein [Alphaproteobacteria bacterium]